MSIVYDESTALKRIEELERELLRYKRAESALGDKALSTDDTQNSRNPPCSSLSASAATMPRSSYS